MSTPNRYSVILGNLGNTCDRFLSSGYKDVAPKKELVAQAAAMPGVKGIELVGTWDITESNADEVKAMLDGHGLSCVSIIPDLFGQKHWGKGSLSAKDSKTRELALAETRMAARIAQQVGCPLVNLWLGQDGYDYPLTADFVGQRGYLTENIRTVASEFPELRFALEYKPKEPRIFSFQARAADTLLMAMETELDNVGVCIDVGHSFVAGENVAEAAVMLQHYGKRLFHMHFNDNYRSWDDDMIVGSVHMTEYFELLYWLKETGYDGWYSMDQYPYREDGGAAVGESVAFLRTVEALLTDERRREMSELIQSGDATRTTRWMRELLFSQIKSL